METKEQQREEHIVSLVRQFCQENLDDEYAQLCEKMVRRLGPDTLATGRPEVWAAAVVYAVGSINFLYDHRFQPYIRSVEISTYFGIGHSTVFKKPGTFAVCSISHAFGPIKSFPHNTSSRKIHSNALFQFLFYLFFNKTGRYLRLSHRK